MVFKRNVFLFLRESVFKKGFSSEGSWRRLQYKVMNFKLILCRLATLLWKPLLFLMKLIFSYGNDCL
jgi:hypothetical protein